MQTILVLTICCESGMMIHYHSPTLRRSLECRFSSSVIHFRLRMLTQILYNGLQLDFDKWSRIIKCKFQLI